MMVKNGYLIFAYRIFSFVISILGLLANMQVLEGTPNYYALFAYTTQSNILVILFFTLLVIKTAQQLFFREKTNNRNYGFYPVLSFVVCFSIFITMIIFWLVLAPSQWADINLLTFFNLGVHFINPVLMILDRFLFYEKGRIKKRQVFLILIFPYFYILQSFLLGLTHAVYFSPIGIDSYYIYPFLDFDKYGCQVFLFIAVLTMIFLLLGYGWHRLELLLKKLCAP